MDAFPSTLNNNDHRHGRRRKRLPRVLILLLVVILVLALGFGLRAAIQAGLARKSEAPSAEQLIASWDAKKYEEVAALSRKGLDYRPLDPLYLVLGGFAEFYRGIGETDGEVRGKYMDDAVFSLRKALTSRSVPFKAQVLYVLGKAYYHKGPYFMDEAVKFLESSVTEGYTATDTLEYVAVAYSNLGEFEKSVIAFEQALSLGKSDLLLLAAARAYLHTEQKDKAETAALEALSITEDSLVREKSRYLLGELYFARGDYNQAENQYKLVLEMNPESADAHYYLGIIWQERGDPIRARAEWRKAVSLDPMHTAARQKLAERI